MKRSVQFSFVFILILFVNSLVFAGEVHKVNFDSLNYREVFGSKPGTIPLTPIFNEDGVVAMVDSFLSDGQKYYKNCYVDSAYKTGVGDGHNMYIGSINMCFDLTSLKVSTTYLTLEFGGLKGHENLVVNNEWWEGEISEISYLELGACIVYINNYEEGLGNLTILGEEIHTVFIGGQDFWIDNLTAYEEIPEKLCVNFESQLLETTYGMKTHDPGDLAFYENIVPVRVDSFYWKEGGAFNYAEIQSTEGIFGIDNVIGMNNINLSFNSDEMPFTPTYISFEFLNMGGYDNLIVNGDKLIGDLFDMNGLSLGETDIYVCSIQTKPGIRGLVQIVGEVHSLKVGGQELLLDNICFYKEAPFAACNHLVDFESLDPDTSFGQAHNKPGDFIFEESDIAVVVEEFYSSPFGKPAFNIAYVEFAPSGTGVCQTMWLNNICLQFDLEKLDLTVQQVSFEFADYGGTENLRVNDGELYIGELTEAPYEIAPGVTCEIVLNGDSEETLTGIVILSGDISTLLVGGQEFFIDNVCVSGELTAIRNNNCNCNKPDRFILEQNYPNPFNPITTINYHIPSAGDVTIEIYNSIGEKIESFGFNHNTSGNKIFKYNGSHLASGVYFYRVITPNFSAVKRMLLVK
ncbi:MAG: T9SS type A sorting domain-containing protein [Calditrichaceae bacterium]|nr:T9SS type A sorting domain-containing protein [Calditrichaceae bacterium]MBN2709557.1 T9SS type A sorting domain-containing protein [Calditrichaceae bacterium]RQV96820.1 MAG: T9SS C-terminal target domain-containing protein [Calditrichota bacterium]